MAKSLGISHFYLDTFRKYCTSSHNHGSQKGVPPIVVTFQIWPFPTSMIIGEKEYSSHEVF